MSVPVRVPKLTMATHECVFVEWLVQDGERVKEEQPLYVVATDKVETEIPSPASGVLRHGAVRADETYPVGTELATIEADGGHA